MISTDARINLGFTSLHTTPTFCMRTKIWKILRQSTLNYKTFITGWKLALSEPLLMRCGVPLGSILGSLLFTVHANDLPSIPQHKALIPLTPAVPAKKDLTLKQTHLASFCFFPCIELRFWQLTLAFSTFYRLYLEITCFCNKSSGQMFLCHVTAVKYYNSFRSLHHDTIVFDYPEFQEFLFNTLQSRMFSVKSVGTEVDFREKCSYIKHLTSQEVGVRGRLQVAY